MIVLGFKDYETQSHKLADALGIPCQLIEQHRFPDGETKLILPVDLPEHIIFCRSLNHPNEKLLELLLAANTARELGANTLTLIAPYLCYMRQDKAFQPGEAVSQPIVGRFIAGLFENVITVDPHLHRIQYLEQAVPATQALTLSATSLMSEFLYGQVEDPVILGPDSESEQWVSSVADPHGWDYGVCRKTRTGDKKVEITLPDIALHGRSVVIVDDIASSGQTLAVATKLCMGKNPKHVDIVVTHALYADKAKESMMKAGVRNMWSTDSVSHESNIIPLCNLLKGAVLKLI